MIGQTLRWILALALLYLILVLPERIEDFDVGARWLLPLELPLIVLALVSFSGGLRIFVRIVVATALTLLLVFKFANMAAYFGFFRPFSPFVDVLMIPTLLDTVGKAAGQVAAIAAVAGIALVLLAFLGMMSWATGVIVRGIPRHYRAAAVMGSLAVAALYFTPYANFNTSKFVKGEAVRAAQSARDAEVFRAQLTEDPLADIPADHRFTALKGTDVLVIFVEAYGRAALDNPAYGPTVRGNLQKFGAALAEKGFAVRSGWALSPTFGGESYLAHSTMASGLWVNDHQRYLQLLLSGRRTLFHDFADAGWRTVGVMPQITMPWPQGDYFGFDRLMIASDLGYKGRPFEYMTMPDQYTLGAFHRAELAPTDRKPVMAEIALISSHIPWAPIPKIVPWEDMGDGTVFNEARTPESADEVWRTPSRVPEFYLASIDYSLQALQAFVTTYVTDNMLVMIIGDHQPMGFVTGEGATFETPMHIIAKNPALLAALETETLAEGMTPAADSATWRMDSIRARLLRAFSRAPDAALSAQPDQPPPPAP